MVDSNVDSSPLRQQRDIAQQCAGEERPPEVLQACRWQQRQFCRFAHQLPVAHPGLGLVKLPTRNREHGYQSSVNESKIEILITNKRSNHNNQ